MLHSYGDTGCVFVHEAKVQALALPATTSTEGAFPPLRLELIWPNFGRA